MEKLKFNRQRIIDLREQVGLSQTNFGKRLETSKQRVNNWEEGISKPNIDALAKICTVFGVEMDYFFSK